MSRSTRRHVLKGIAATAIVAPAVFSARRARAALPPLPNLPATDALLLQPGDAQFATYQPAFNARTMLTPQLRAMCKSASAVGTMVDWCRSNKLAFAIRCGGHSYEGFSQSASIVIDTRLLSAATCDANGKTVACDAKSMTATVGAGASLGAFYNVVAPHNLGFPGGSCPTVGISGHVLGGGYGHLARPFGLACDSLLSIDLIDPQGKPVHADAQQNPDLFWACRGGGGGSFGIATGYSFQLHTVASVYVFKMTWSGLSPSRAAAIMKTWAAWAPQAPVQINSHLTITSSGNGTIDLLCGGQSIGTRAQLQHELSHLSSTPRISQMSYTASINYFAGTGGWTYTSAPMKGKSDYVASPMSDAGLAALMNALSKKADVYVICDSYGGTIATPAADATAFAHRKGTLFSMQYATGWSNATQTPQHLADIRAVYAAMRPYVSGQCYVNYCDLDLTDYPTAYWGANLARLKKIKAAFDPDNVFQHAQSIPVA
jgi:FAD/FMN-containing dehydrogenase